MRTLVVGPADDGIEPEGKAMKSDHNLTGQRAQRTQRANGPNEAI
jgi:hypothetical protein